MDFVKAIKVLKGKKWTVILVSAVSFLLILAAPKPQIAEVAPTYSSKAKVLMTPPSSGVSAFGGQSLQGVSDFSWFAEPAVLNELIKSDELLSRVIELSESRITKEELGYSITIEPLSDNGYRAGGVNLFGLSVMSKDPKQAQKLTRLVTDEFVRYVEDLSAREFASTRRFIEELVLEAEGRRDSAETALLGIRERYYATQSEEDLISKARNLESRINEVERESSAVSSQVTSLQDYRSGASSSPPWQILSSDNGALTQLQANVANKKLDLVKLQDIYVETSEQVVKAKRQLATADSLYRAAMAETVESLYKTKSSELEQGRAQAASMNSELNNLLKSRMSDEDRRLTTKFERELGVWEQNYLNLQQQLYQARVIEQSSRRSGAVSVLEQPGVGTVAFDPNAKQAVAQSTQKRNILALPFCIALGIVAALLQEYLTSSTKLRPRVEEALELPVLAVIPATPSELTIDWETFKRPGGERLAKLELASIRAPGFAERSKLAHSHKAKEPGTDKDENSGGSFGDQFRFRNQK